MKKFLIATGVAVFAFAAVAGAQSTVFSTNLTIGSTGADVVALQTALINGGFNIPSIASGAAAKGYFGSQTQAAVKAYQTAKGIPSTGFVGPLTRGALNGAPVSSGSASVSCPVGFVCTAVGGGTTLPTTISGTEGTISDVNELSQYSNEEVGDGESAVKVAGFEVEASNEGDILLKSIKVSFDAAGNGTGDSDNLDDYIESVSIMMGSTVIGSADVSGFNEDSNGVWSKTISLKNAVVKADDIEKFYVTVDAVSNMDSEDINSDSWAFDVESIRYEDGSGVTTTETGYDIDGMDVAIDFVNFAASADTELKISTDSSSPDALIVSIDEDNDTDNVVLLVGKMRLDGSSDVVIDELPITLTTSGDSLTAVASALTLKIGSDEWTKSVTSSSQTGTTTFDNLDLTVKAGSTVTFTVLADINDINDSGATTTDLDEGDVIKADLTSTNREYVDAENEEGDQLGTSEKSGQAVGEYQELRTQGIAVELIGTPTATVSDGASANTDTGNFVIKFKVTAFGENMYVATSSYYVYKGTTATTSGSFSGVLENDTDEDTEANGSWMIEEGTSENFTLTVTVPLSAGTGAGSYQARLAGIGWDTDDDATPDNAYTSELDSFKTPYVSLN